MASVAGLVRRFHKRLFDFSTADVLKTPPVTLQARSGVVVLSQTYHKDLYMYLVAAKTFAHHVGVSGFIIVDDGLTDKDRALIIAHLVNVQFVARTEVDNPVCPAVGCWERLLSVVDNSRGQYVVQLDSDTVTLANPSEVIEAIAANRCFTLSTRQGRAFVPVPTAAAFARETPGDHIQILSEMKMAEMPELRDHFYIRGCAGFTGFAAGAIQRSRVEQLSSLFQQALGDAWKRWGSEQFMSNFLIANSSQPVALPYEAYPYWEPDQTASDAKFIHFIGDHRFTSASYGRIAGRAIKSLAVV